MEDGVAVLPRVSCPFIIRGRHDAVINLRDTRLYHHTRPDILLPADDDQEDDSVGGQKDRMAEEVTTVPDGGDTDVDDVVSKSDPDHLRGLRFATVPDGGDADVDDVVSKSDPDHLRGLRLPNLDGSSMKFLHQVIIFVFLWTHSYSLLRRLLMTLIDAHTLAHPCLDLTTHHIDS